MLLSALITLSLVAVPLISWQVGTKIIKKQNKAIILQWGRFINTRNGLKNSPFHENEPDIVEFRDFKFWVRLYPNPGFNLPVLGYWSKFRGRRR